MYARFFKPLCDRAAALLLLLVLWPLLLVVALLIRMESEGPALFRQKRLGKGGKDFEILKFRSMKLNAEKSGSGVYSEKGDPRVTRIGRILRATSLDELPQLFNILKGDMSWVGPRPPLTYHPWPLAEYSEEQRHMFDVLPGITGWAQVNGRKAVEWNRRIELNVWYVRHISFLLDMKIAFMTFFKVLCNADNENDGATVNK